ncbi:protein kinase C and casein kinase substrate in neurons protein 2 [Thalassophryne amazonica]|uniref:protein kinase C and casein kinase substrate in neurons protein 2 n=1 Tax=Thalassophryne amazonica TaxID=390379 RepID=UPI0014724195|nr:protein kinase C and casein kinase substrate in neurons protein 2 [Thalassophryne amazonica]XP_034046149.1 protein kinase C and casein kinase substrate in neurons protein 2 [Thalassophryne amazonica]
MSSLQSEHGAVDPNSQSFWMPGNYQHTVKRTEDTFHACSDIVACFRERARVERQYAQQLRDWSNKWKPVVESSLLYGSLRKGWQGFLSSADRLAASHTSVCCSLVSEDGDRVHTWQKNNFHKKLFGGFKESHELKKSFAHAQKPWAKRLKKLEKAKKVYFKVSCKEQEARDRDAHAQGNPDFTIEKQKKIEEDRMLAHHETVKARAHYENALDDVNQYAPRYMEAMESVFEQSQDEERNRIVFLKQAFLSLHKHLDTANDEGVKTIYNELHDKLTAIDEQQDLLWWRNTYGPGMPTDWPRFQEWRPAKENMKRVKQKETTEKAVMIGGVRVRALYDYIGQDTEELSFQAGEEFLKVKDADEHDWCWGKKAGGTEGYYPANYVEVV